MNTSIIQSGDIKLKVFTQGKKGSTSIVLVHGYPDSHSVWKRVAELLSNHYYVITYDVRGAGDSEIPRSVSDYNIKKLSADLLAVVNSQIGDSPFHLVGHDWGSIQSWESVTAEGPLKQRILSFTSISGPCLDHMGFWLRKNSLSISVSAKLSIFKQAVSSWYIGFFHLPAVAPNLWRIGLAKLWPYYLKYRENITDADLNPTQIKDGRFGVQLYQANFRKKLFQPEERFASCPVQLIVPSKDNYVGAHLFDDLHHWVDDLYRRDIEANHWVPLSHPETISEWVIEFVESIEKNKITKSLEKLRVFSNRNKKSVEEKVALITGAGSGIGRATAFELAEAGANIVCVDINEVSAKRTAELCRALGANAWSRQVDVGSSQAMQRLANWVDKEIGGADIVINNAGIGMAGGVLDTTPKDWEAILKVNLWGVLHGSRMFAEQMIKNNSKGHIINVASAAAFAPNRKLAAYSTSKAAVHMLSECLRAELADKHIGVTAVCPGFVATDIAKNTVYAGLDSETQRKKQAKADALYRRRNFPPEEVAKSIHKAILTNQPLSLVGVEAWTTRLSSRFTPSLSRRVAQIDITP